MFKRKLLVGVSVAALIAVQPILASKFDWYKADQLAAAVGLLSVGYTPAGAFQGNPNAVFTSIDVSGGITLSRTSGYCVPANASISSPGSPCFVQVSASAITASGTITSNGSTINVSALSDLEFTWNFGDGGGTETLTNPATGLTVNANTGQTGGEAAYAYRTAGTKTITLRIRGKNGSGGYIIATTSTTFTVNDMTAASGYRARYVDYNNGDDTWDGTAPQFVSGTTGPKKTLTSTNGLFKSGVLANTCCAFLAMGSTWTQATDGNININGFPISRNLRFTSYLGATSSSSNPKIVTSAGFSGTNKEPIVITNGSATLGNGSSISDICISYIDTETNTTGTCYPLKIEGVNATDPGATASDIYIDNCNFKISSSSPPTSGAFTLRMPYQCLGSPLCADSRNMGSWKCNFDAPQTGAVSTFSGFGMQCRAWTFVVGGRSTGDGTSGTFDHSIYFHGGSHTLFRWFDTTPLNGATKTFGKNYGLNVEMDWMPDAAFVSANTSCTGKIPTAGAGAGASTTFVVTGMRTSRPIVPGSGSAGMFLFAQSSTGLTMPVQVTADISLNISSITWSGGVATITTSSAHSVNSGSYIIITISGASPSAYNGTVTATYQSATQLTFPLTNNPGGSAGACTYTGNQYTITPGSGGTIPQITSGLTGFALGKFNAVFLATYTAATKTVSVQSGSLIGNINAGDACTNITTGVGALTWAPIDSVAGLPSSFTITLLPSFTAFTDISTPVFMYTLPFAQPTILSSILIDGCKLATTNLAYSGNSSTNDATYMYWEDFVCQNTAFVNLQTGGAASQCVRTHTLRNTRSWGSVAATNGIYVCNLGGSSHSLWGTAHHAIYNCAAYNNSSMPNGGAAGIFAEGGVSPTSTIPFQLTDNKFWTDVSSGAINLLDASASGNSSALIDRNAYNAPSSTNFMRNVASSISYAAWRALNGGIYDPNSTNVNNATPTGAFSDWTVPPTQWSDLGA